MKKKTKHYSIKLPPLRLYMDDIDEIGSILESNFEIYSIETPEYELYSFDEVKEINDEILYKLEFTTYNPYFKLVLANNGTTLECDDDDKESIGIIYQIKSILDKRRILKFANKDWFGIILLSGIIILFSLSILSSKTSIINNEYTTSLVTSLISYIVITIFIAYLINYINEKKHTLIYISYKKERPNFFVRNKDDLILVLIGAFFGSLFGAFFIYILYKLNMLG